MLAALRAASPTLQAGRLPAAFPTIEWYIHTTRGPVAARRRRAPQLGAVRAVGAAQARRLDLGGGGGRATSSTCCRSATLRAGHQRPGGRHVPAAPAEDRDALRHHRGHIHHVDNAFGFADRMPYATGVDGLYAGAAGCHPAGSVIGAAGHNAAAQILADLG